MGKHAPNELKTAVCPFKEDLKINVFIKGYSESRINPANIQMADGVITGVGTVDKMYKSWVLEQDKRVNLYTTNNGKPLDEYYQKLTVQSRLLLEYILFYCLREDKLYCYIDSQEFSDKYNLKSRTTFWSCKKTLINAGFIAETAYRGWYWINPKLIFKGVRHKTEELQENITIITKKDEEK